MLPEFVGSDDKRLFGEALGHLKALAAAIQGELEMLSAEIADES